MRGDVGFSDNFDELVRLGEAVAEAWNGQVDGHFGRFDKVTNQVDWVLVTNRKTNGGRCQACLLYTSPSPRDRTRSRMPSSA